MENKIITDGNKFKAIRKFLHLTQEEFAKKLGIGQPYYSAIETDKKQPSIQVLDRIFELGVSGTWFFQGIGDIIIDDFDKSVSREQQTSELIDANIDSLKEYYNGIAIRTSHYEYQQIKFYERFNLKKINTLIDLAHLELESIYNTYIKLNEIIHFFGGPGFLLEKFKTPSPYTTQIAKLASEHHEEMEDCGVTDEKLKNILYLISIEKEKEHWISGIEQFTDYMYLYKQMIKDYIINPSEFS